LLTNSRKQKSKKELIDFLKSNVEANIDEIVNFLCSLWGDFPSYNDVNEYLKELENEGIIERIGTDIRYLNHDITKDLYTVFSETYKAKIILSLNNFERKISIPRIINEKVEILVNYLKENHIDIVTLEPSYHMKSDSLIILIGLKRDIEITMHITNNTILIESFWNPKSDNIFSDYVSRVVGMYGNEYKQFMKLIPLSYALLIMNIIEEILFSHPILKNSLKISIDNIEHRE